MKNDSFLGLLAESPFAGLQEHMSCLLYTSDAADE